MPTTLPPINTPIKVFSISAMSSCLSSKSVIQVKLHAEQMAQIFIPKCFFKKGFIVRAKIKKKIVMEAMAK